MDKPYIKAVAFDVRGVIVNHNNDRDIIPGIAALLKKLKHNGIILAIVSSFPVMSVEDMIGDLKLFFGDNIYSGSGKGKLDKLVDFANEIKIDLSEIAFIDDKPDNLKPVKHNSKVFTIAFRGSGKYYPDILHCCKELKIKFADNINELEDILLK